jgi:hypothetical protein
MTDSSASFQEGRATHVPDQAENHISINFSMACSEN